LTCRATPIARMAATIRNCMIPSITRLLVYSGFMAAKVTFNSNKLIHKRTKIKGMENGVRKERARKKGSFTAPLIFLT
jgi:hypothetical protein